MVVDSQVSDHMRINNLEEVFQSAYKMHHSTETAMVRIHNDILSALDENQAVLLVCLDLSAAFDTVDHSILLNRLEKRLGITGKCLSWFHSYLTGRTQKVVLQGVASKHCDLSCGVPQGSVLGPKLFTIYTLPIGDIIRVHNISFHIYADDKNLYLAFKQLDINNTSLKMEHLIMDVRSWLILNMLKFNDDKTEFMVINGPRRKYIDLPTLKVGEVDVSVSQSARALGVQMDNTMSMCDHVNNVTKASFFKLRNMFKIRKCVTEEAAKSMVHAMVTSSLDYCNALLYGLPDCLVNKL